MSRARRVLLFPPVRAVVAIALLAALAAPLFLLLRAAGRDGDPVWMELALAFASLAALAFVVRVIERRPFFATLLPSRGAARDLGLGLGLGTALMATTMAVLAGAGWYHVTGLAAPSAGAAALAMLRAVGLFFLVALFEETLFRGIVFRLLEDGLGSWAGLSLSAAIFGLMHLGGPDATLGAGIAIALEAGVLLSALFLVRRTLWLPIGTHWAWNLFEGPVFGCGVSGQHEAGLLRSVTAGPEVWTGGRFGPEAGLVCVLVCTAVGVAVVVGMARRGRMVRPMWRRPKDEATTGEQARPPEPSA